MPAAIRFHRTGGPEVLCLEEVEIGAPAPGEARVRHYAIGLNFIDTYHRSGLYPLPLPSGIGLEGAGARPHGKTRSRLRQSFVAAAQLLAQSGE